MKVKIKLSVSAGLWLYYAFLSILYHLEVKHYFYWVNIANKMDGVFDFSFSRFLFATILFALNVRGLVSKKSNGLIYPIATVFLVLLTVPSLIAYTSKSMYPTQLLIFHQLLFWSLLVIGSLEFKPFIKLPALKRKQILWLLFGVTFIGIIPYLIAYGPHLNIKNLWLVDVYKTRASVAGISNPYFGYTYSLFTKIIIPLLLVFSLELKNKLFVSISIVFLVLFYMFGAHKSVYLGIIFILIFYRFSYKEIVEKMLLFLNGLVVLSLVLSFFSFDYLWVLTIRRIQFLPTLLDICYLDFFRDAPLYWSESILGGIIDYPFDTRSTRIIGQAYFGRLDMSANNGLVSDGFMNANSMGVLMNIFLVSIFFMVLNNLRLPSKYFGLYFRVALSFISSSLITVFVTHGAFFLLLVSIFLLRERKK